MVSVPAVPGGFQLFRTTRNAYLLNLEQIFGYYHKILLKSQSVRYVSSIVVVPEFIWDLVLSISQDHYCPAPDQAGLRLARMQPAAALLLFLMQIGYSCFLLSSGAPGPRSAIAVPFTPPRGRGSHRGALPAGAWFILGVSNGLGIANCGGVPGARKR